MISLRICDPQETRAFLASHSAEVSKLPDTMRKCRVEEEVIEGVAGRCAEVAVDLREAKKKG